MRDCTLRTCMYEHNWGRSRNAQSQYGDIIPCMERMKPSRRNPFIYRRSDCTIYARGTLQLQTILRIQCMETYDRFDRCYKKTNGALRVILHGLVRPIPSTFGDATRSQNIIHRERLCESTKTLVLAPPVFSAITAFVHR